MTVIAHVSDMHIDGTERSARRAGRVLRYLAGLPTPVDVVVVTGDVTDHGTEDEYEQVRGLVDLPVPVLYCPGNHDARGPFRKVLLDETPAGSPVNRAYRVGGVLFAMCDSVIPGRSEGALADETLDWLEAELAAAGGCPVFVCLHHPPIVVGVPYVDKIRLQPAQRLSDLIAAHPEVVAILCGHAHTPAVTTLAGRPVVVAPSLVSTALLPFESDTIVDVTLPPMLALHLLDDDRRLTTHYRVVV